MKIRIILEAEVETKGAATLLTERAAAAAKEAADDSHGTVTYAGWSNRRDRKVPNA